jgi:hypothetical protein
MTYDEFLAESQAHWAGMDRVPDVLGAALADDRLRFGAWVEFGVYQGATLRRIAEAGEAIDAEVWGVDSFRGLPETWRNGYETGTFALDAIPLPPKNANLLVGPFERVLGSLRLWEPVTLAHIDSDLYSSGREALRWLAKYFVPGVTIFVFDELHSYPAWEMGEMRALYEFVEGRTIEWLYLGAEGAALRVHAP